MEVDIPINKYEAKVIIEAIDCLLRNWCCDGMTANTLYNRIVDAFKKQGVDLEADDEEDDE